MIPFNVLTHTRHGPMLANRSDIWVGRSLLHFGEFSELEVAFLVQFVSHETVVLDIGANVGALTLPLARRAKAVIAFEPQRLCFQSLCANVALNSLANVVAYPYAVGAENGQTRIPFTDPNQPNNFGGIALAENANGEYVQVVALDDMGLPPCGLLKADVEGMEADVLRGAKAYIAEHQPVLYLEADRGDKRAGLLSLLGEYGYDAYRHEPLLFNADNYRGDRHNIFGLVASINVLALPAGRTPPEGLEKAI